mmetsp:Transcript_40710/g.62140  ORF Transcript_40710/g.62140 Transcript_40710/m.62140 type:complete len:90 (-) Transcript_40710:60-329(-)
MQEALAISLTYTGLVLMVKQISNGLLNPALGLSQQLFQYFISTKYEPQGNKFDAYFLMVYFTAPFLGGLAGGLLSAGSEQADIVFQEAR